MSTLLFGESPPSLSSPKLRNSSSVSLWRSGCDEVSVQKNVLHKIATRTKEDGVILMPVVGVYLKIYFIRKRLYILQMIKIECVCTKMATSRQSVMHVIWCLVFDLVVIANKIAFFCPLYAIVLDLLLLYNTSKLSKGPMLWPGSQVEN
jgi:hypothetical protein